MRVTRVRVYEYVMCAGGMLCVYVQVCLKVHAVENLIIFMSQNINTTKEQHSSHQGHEGPMVTARHIVFLW